MNAYELSFLSLLLFGLIFVIIASLASSAIKSAKSFYHSSNVWSNTISLTVANVTLGTGLVYLMTVGMQFGILAFAIPISTYLGYTLISRLSSQAGELGEGENLFKYLQKRIDEIHSSKCIPLSKVLSLCLAFIFALVLSYELLAAPQFIVPYIVDEPGLLAKVFVSSFLFVVSVFTVMSGGIKGVFRTDWIQFIAIIVVVSLLVITLLVTISKSATICPISDAIRIDTNTLFAILMASLTAIATQLYSLLNLSTASHLSTENRKIVFKRVGVAVGLILSIFIASGNVAGLCEKNVIDSISNGFKGIAASNSILSYAMGTIIAFGFTSIVVSTCDSLVIVVSQFAYDNIFKKDSYDDTSNYKAIRNIRYSILGAFISVFLFLGCFYYLNPNLFQLLMALSSGIVVYAPFILILYLLAKDQSRIYGFRSWMLWTYFMMFCLVSIISFILLLGNKGQYIARIGSISILVSSTFSYIIWKTSLNTRLAQGRA